MPRRCLSPGCLAARIRPLRAALAGGPDQVRQAELDALLAERNRLVEANTGLVGLALHKCPPRCLEMLGGWDDAYGQGLLALIDAAELFDADRGFAFSTYAVWSIYYRITREAPELASVRIGQKKYLAMLRAEEHIPGFVPWPKTAAGEPVDLPERAGPDLAESRSEMEPVWKALGRLSRRERQMIRLRFMHGETLEATGQRFGFTKEAARNLQNKALASLRKILQPGTEP